MRSYKEYKEKALQNPEVRAEYERLIKQDEDNEDRKINKEDFIKSAGKINVDTEAVIELREKSIV